MDGEELGKTRSQTKNEAKNGEDAEAPEENGNGNGKGDDDDEEDEPDSEQNGNHAEDEKSPAKRTRAKDDSVQVCVHSIDISALAHCFVSRWCLTGHFVVLLTYWSRNAGQDRPACKISVHLSLELLRFSSVAWKCVYRAATQTDLNTAHESSLCRILKK